MCNDGIAATAFGPTMSYALSVLLLSSSNVSRTIRSTGASAPSLGASHGGAVGSTSETSSPAYTTPRIATTKR